MKPFGARELMARVSSRIEIARLRRQATERERELRLLTDAERERWRDLLLLAPAVIAVLRGPDHVFDLVNPPYVRAVGRKQAESLLGKPLREALPEIEGQGLLELLDHVYRTGEPYVGSERLVRLDMNGDGLLEDRYFNFVYQPSRDLRGDVEGILVHAMDVTDQVLARRRVEDSERQLRTLADSMPQQVWMADPDGFMFWCNRRWYEFTGMNPEETIGWRWQSVHEPEYLPKVLERWRRSLATGEPFEMEFPLRSAGGEYRWFLSRGTPVRDASGRILRWYGTNTDVEDRKRAEEAIRQKQRLESTGLLAGGVAHDFNNLLTGVLGSASLLLEELPPTGYNSELVKGIVDAAERAAHLTRQMLAYAGKGSFIIQKLNLGEHIREIADLIHAAIPKKITVDIDISEQAPWIEADPGHLQQIAMNLVINAAEAIGADRPGVIRIRSRVETVTASSAGQFIPERPGPGRYAVLDVQDDGAGMDEELAARIFDPFFSTKFTGRGLGLSAVLGIVRSHGGAITLQSEPGRGSTFCVFLPSVAAPQVTSGDVPEHVSEWSPGAVLIIDDEEIVRRTAAQTLQHFGYTALTAADGSEGLEMLRQRRGEIDAVLLDLTMPVMDGLEALRHMERIAPDVPVILSSGYEEGEATERFSGRKLAGFIQKPYTASKLMRLLGKIVNSRREASGARGVTGEARR